MDTDPEAGSAVIEGFIGFPDSSVSDKYKHLVPVCGK